MCDYATFPPCSEAEERALETLANMEGYTTVNAADDAEGHATTRMVEVPSDVIGDRKDVAIIPPSGDIPVIARRIDATAESMGFPAMSDEDRKLFAELQRRVPRMNVEDSRWMREHYPAAYEAFAADIARMPDQINDALWKMARVTIETQAKELQDLLEAQDKGKLFSPEEATKARWLQDNLYGRVTSSSSSSSSTSDSRDVALSTTTSSG
jgi:hypothetical protein